VYSNIYGKFGTSSSAQEKTGTVVASKTNPVSCWIVHSLQHCADHHAFPVDELVKSFSSLNPGAAQSETRTEKQPQQHLQASIPLAKSPLSRVTRPPRRSPAWRDEGRSPLTANSRPM
jgi:hypothetical protein